MRAIRTQYFGPTAHREARVVASDGESMQASHSCGLVCDEKYAHAMAAQALRNKLKVRHRLIGGELRHGEMVWVFSSSPDRV